MIPFTKKIILCGISLFAMTFARSQENDSLLDYCHGQYTRMLGNLHSYYHYPRTMEDDGSFKLVTSNDWTSGFFPGSLWYLYEHSGDTVMKNEAHLYTKPISARKNNTGTHDLGFMFYCSFGNAYRITGEEYYKKVMLVAAQSLASRYNEKVGCIRSWDFGSWEFPVIIDNMMNLEFLFWASRETSDSSYYEMARQHALTTMENHFREDHSSYHVIDYNKNTGEVISKDTHQGYSDESAWSRGQAWGLYGYTMVYRETGEQVFLDKALNIANYISKNLPDDLIPYWDFDAPGIPDVPKDASAAAITASALIELSGLTEINSEKYLSLAKNIIQNLSSARYLSKPNENKNFILLHSTGSKPHNSEIDVPLNYADYYYVEALTRLKKLEETENTSLKTPTLSALDVLVYPNPTKRRVTIQSNQKIKLVEVMDHSGKTIQKIINPNPTAIHNLAPGNFSPGLYIIKTTTILNQVHISKIIVQ